MNVLTPVTAVCLLILVAYMAHRSGRSPYRWFFLSLLITPLISAIILICIKFNERTVRIPCPSCGGLVATWDSICEHCNHSLGTDMAFVENAKKAQSMSSSAEVEEKNRIATEGYEAFIAGNSKSENPYKLLLPADEVKASYWERGFAVAERKKGRGEKL